MRLKLTAACGVLAALLCAPAAQGAEAPRITEAKGSTFPDRSYVLTLPDRRALRPADVTVNENGRPVGDVSVRGDISGSAVVLVIDASNSMRGQAIEDAMAAARAFAARRRPEQRLGVLFFNGDVRVGQPLTTDAAKIEAVLAAPPPLALRTRIFDATQAAVEMLEAADVVAGSVVVLSDGDDVGSAAIAGEVVTAAERQRIRIFTVGLRASSDFDSTSLRGLAAADGAYSEALRSKDLERIFESLGRRFGNEYVLDYRSESPLGSQVAVTVEVTGYPGFATATYSAPRLSVPAGGGPPDESPWQSGQTMIIVTCLVAILVGLALFLVVRPQPGTVGQRIARFVFQRPDAPLPVLDTIPTESLLARLQRGLDGMRPWRDLALDVEVAKLRMTPLRIALLTACMSLLLAFIVWKPLGAPFAAVVIAVAVLAGVRAAVAMLAKRVRRRFAEQLADNLQVLASALRAGHSFMGALSVMAEDAAEPSRQEYRRVVSDERLGIAVEESLAAVSHRMRNDEVSYIGLIATLQRETGGNTAEVLDRVVNTIRERMQLRRLVRTLTAQGRLGGWVVTALPIGFAVLLNITTPHYMDPMLDEPLGKVILVAGAVMVGVGAMVVRKIVDIKV
jgi:tight adherence protein B